ncbi:hypothetical protein JQ615_11960 [Bradyrhizobium jicamae]|uniref:Uncharacterized protein n=1 Tax=Bradyrhizobium jicamae TaxID=280332 RepID=A0ABS5FHF5_9BRAD|nr:hypothetical protein [Bradyrhizobium jicamae]MBR0796104.1 hypothetical protein [Bradyrhizobium jicamae]
MTKSPPPYTGPLPPPWIGFQSEEEEAAHDWAAHEAWVSLVWQDALDWAKRGDRRSLVALLRGEYISDHSMVNDMDVRAFLADVLEGTVKRPRGKPAQRPEYTWAIAANGQPAMVDKRDARFLEIKRWLSLNKKSHPDRDSLLEAAAKHFKMDINALEEIARRSSKAWVRSRST